ncbi:XK-related protein 6-like [Hetaerina americana]|uniref:XK-related protein 6-like n=1 Tax=Hetaerina americana TaxID=62018 RepID=UPI003A7F42F5
MIRSVQYAINSVRSYDDIAQFYSILHSNRCNKGKKHFQRESIEEDSSHIQAVFLAMQTWNERFILQTKITEVLNESAPQLLLQLSIATRESLEHNSISFMTWASIMFSIVSFSWTMHQAHSNRHYNSGGRVLDNAYSSGKKLMEFLANLFVYCSRVLSICSFTAVHHVWFFFGASVYLLMIYLSLIFFSERKIMYKGLHRYKATVFWPLHRMFTIPYRIGLWRLDSMDHLLFYLETLVLAITLPFVLHDRLDFNLACAISGAIVLCEIFGIVLMIIFRKYVHPDGYVCKSLM